MPKKQGAVLTGKLSPGLSCLCIYELHLNICRHATPIASLGLHLVLNWADLETEGKEGQRKQEWQLVSCGIFLLPILLLVLVCFSKCSFTIKATLLLHEDMRSVGLLEFSLLQAALQERWKNWCWGRNFPSLPKKTGWFRLSLTCLITQKNLIKSLIAIQLHSIWQAIIYLVLRKMFFGKYDKPEKLTPLC